MLKAYPHLIITLVVFVLLLSPPLLGFFGTTLGLWFYLFSLWLFLVVYLRKKAKNNLH